MAVMPYLIGIVSECGITLMKSNAMGEYRMICRTEFTMTMIAQRFGSPPASEFQIITMAMHLPVSANKAIFEGRDRPSESDHDDSSAICLQIR